jgi:hypothetical protein
MTPGNTRHLVAKNCRMPGRVSGLKREDMPIDYYSRALKHLYI